MKTLPKSIQSVNTPSTANLRPCVNTIVRKQRMRGFCDHDLELGIPSHFYLQSTTKQRVQGHQNIIGII